MDTVGVFSGEWIECRKDQNGIMHVVFMSKNASVNKFNRATLSELKQVVSLLKVDTSKKGVLFSSAKSVFIVGADITEFIALFEQARDQLVSWLLETQKIFNDIEDLAVPTVTAINGVCLGGGFEFALASAYRVASTKAVVGLPEVKLGIYPGWGGTIRFPRLVGADNAIEWIAGGDQHKAEAALKVGAVDTVVEPEKLLDVAYKVLNEAIKGNLDWRSRQEEKKSPLKLLSPIEGVMAFETAKAFIIGKAGKNYPAPLKALETMQKTASCVRDAATRVEIDGFIDVAKTNTAKSLVGIFLSDQYNKKSNKKYTAKSFPVKSACVVGAGIMGGGIAYQSARSGVPIVMKDITREALELGMSEASKLLSKVLKKGKITEKKMMKVMGSISPTLSYGDFKTSDVVVEAVVENENIKKTVLREIENSVNENTVIASNTSTISIDDLADGLRFPEKFCGMHFFNPVHRMPLVEIIKGRRTSEETVARVVNYALQMKKVPIVVNNCAGFLVNRVLFPYFFGLMELLKEGVSFKKIDKAMEDFGWPMGPCYLLDVIGLDTSCHASSVMSEAYPERMSSSEPSLLKVFLNAGRLGQKNGKGFYQYKMDKKGRPKKTIDPDTEVLLKEFSKGVPKEVTDTEIIERMMIPLITESARCLEEGIVATPMEVDLGVIYGLGFPPFHGGVLKYADTVGLSAVCEKISEYSSFGGCYTVPAILQKYASEGRNFYPQI